MLLHLIPFISIHSSLLHLNWYLIKILANSVNLAINSEICKAAELSDFNYSFIGSGERNVNAARK